jgi:hypothetical protein
MIEKKEHCLRDLSHPPPIQLLSHPPHGCSHSPILPPPAGGHDKVIIFEGGTIDDESYCMWEYLEYTLGT